jgi:hypothetical protein
MAARCRGHCHLTQAKVVQPQTKLPVLSQPGMLTSLLHLTSQCPSHCTSRLGRVGLKLKQERSEHKPRHALIPSLHCKNVTTGPTISHHCRLMPVHQTATFGGPYKFWYDHQPMQSPKNMSIVLFLGGIRIWIQRFFAYKAGTLPLEPKPVFNIALIISTDGVLRNYFPRLTLNHNPTDLNLHVSTVIDMNHWCPVNLPILILKTRKHMEKILSPEVSLVKTLRCLKASFTLHSPTQHTWKCRVRDHTRFK